MKVARPNTDQEAEFQIYVNGKACKELVLPSTADTAPSNIAQCFIAVEPGDRLSIKGTFTGSVWAGTFDLVADGSFLHESRIEGVAGNGPKIVKNRKAVFEKVLNCPYPPEWKSISAPTPMFEGTLNVKKLEDTFVEQYSEWETPIADAPQPGIGSLCVTVNISTDSISKYFKPDRWIDIDGVSDERDIIGGWRRQPVQSERELQPIKPQVVFDSGIQPDCQLFFQENPDNDSDAGQKRSSKHRKHWQETRPGVKPWCKFCFFYRSKPALEEAGCVERSGEVQQLDPATDFTQGIDPKAKKKKNREEEEKEEEDMSPPTKKRQQGQFLPSKHLGGTLELPKTKGTLGGTLHLPGKSPSKSPSADSSGRSKTRVSDTAFLRELADYEADYVEVQAEEDGSKQRHQGGREVGGFDSSTDSTHENDGEESFKRPSRLGRKLPAAVNSSYPIDRLGEPVMFASTDRERTSMSRLTSNGSIALGDHKRSHYSRHGKPRSSDHVSSKVRSANSSKALPARSSTNTFDNNYNGNTSSTSTSHRHSSNMTAFQAAPTASEIRLFIGPDGCVVKDLIEYFQGRGPYLNETVVRREFQKMVNEIASTDEETQVMTLRPYRTMRTRRDSSRVATNTPSANTTPTTRKQASINTELFTQPPPSRTDTQADLTEPFNYPEPVANDESRYETALPAANTPTIKQASTAEPPADTPTTSDRSHKRGILEMAGHTDTDTDAPTPTKKHTLTSDDDLEQARQRLEATKRRIENERKEMQVKKAQKDAEKLQQKLAFEAEMARRAEKKRIKDEKKRLKEEEKARKAEELRRIEEEKRREEEERAAEEERLKAEAEQEKQREMDTILLQQEQEEILFAEEQLANERAEVEEAEEDFTIPPESDSESEGEDAAAEESEEELTNEELTMMHRACSSDEDAVSRSQWFQFEMSSSETFRGDSE